MKLYIYVYVQFRDRSVSSLQGCRSGESSRLSQIWPGLDSQTRRQMSFDEFISVLFSTPKCFTPGTTVFPSPQKPKFDLIRVHFLVSPISAPALED